MFAFWIGCLVCESLVFKSWKDFQQISLLDLAYERLATDLKIDFAEISIFIWVIFGLDFWCFLLKVFKSKQCRNQILSIFIQNFVAIECLFEFEMSFSHIWRFVKTKSQNL